MKRSTALLTCLGTAVLGCLGCGVVVYLGYGRLMTAFIGPPSFGLLDDVEPPPELAVETSADSGSSEPPLRLEHTLTLSMESPEGIVSEAVFDDSGRYLALAEDITVVRPSYRMRTRLHVWDLDAGEPLYVKAFDDLVTDLAGGRRRFATADAGGEIRLWDAATGEELRSFDGPETSLCVALDEAAGLLAASFDDDERTVVAWDLDGGERRLVMEGDWECQRLAFTTSGGKQLFGRFGLGRNQIWSIDDGRLVRRFNDRHFSEFTYDALSPSGRLLATNNEGDDVKVWDTWTGKTVRELRVHDTSGPHDTQLVFMMDGRYLVVAEYGGWMHLWRLATSERVVTLRCAEAERQTLLGQSGDGRRLACVVGDTATVWEWR